MVQAAGSLDDLLDGIRAAADPSRLRLLAICSQGEWTVSELVPDPGAEPAAHLPPSQDPGRGRPARPLSRGQLGVLPACPDRRRRAAGALAVPAAAGRRRRACGSTSGGSRRCARRGGARPSAIFDERADAWDSERDLAVDGGDGRERRCASCSPPSGRPACSTSAPGTGRILQVLAGQIGFGLGIDLSHDMLAVARANLDQREARNCQVRHGDMYQLPLPDALVRRGDAASGAALRRRSVRRPGRGLPRAGARRPARRRRSGGARAGAAARGQPASPARLQRRGDRPLVRRSRPGAGAAAAAGRARAHRRDLDRPAPARRRRRDNA